MTTPKKTSLSAMPVNPFGLWLDLSLKATEMMVASSQVVAHRTGRMMAASIPPSEKDSREFTFMGAEKSEAAMESYMAMMKNMMSINPLTAAKSFQNMSGLSQDMWKLAASQTPGEMMTRGVKLSQSMTRAGKSASAASNKVAKLALDGMKPVHARAVANAKRLGKITP